MSRIVWMGALELAKAIRDRRITAREAVDAFLERIEKADSGINAVVTLDPERARREAEEADREADRGDFRGPFHGVPMTIKDTFETKGLRTTAGSPELSEHVPDTDALTVSRLRGSGIIVLGKTNTPLLAGDCQTYNDVFGQTNNPWDPTRSPAGSSGGAAAALASGMTPLELGSDIGGSIRHPAHACGVYGHKPTWGIVPSRGHIPGPPGTLADADLNVCGPLARSPRDLEAALAVLAGPDPARGTAWKLEIPPPRHRELSAYRVGAWLDDPVCPVSMEVREVFAAGLERLRNAGVDVDESARPLDDADRAVRVFQNLLWPVVASESPAEQLEPVLEAAASLSPDDDSMNARLVRGITISHRDWIAYNEQREHLRVQWAALFEKFDVLLCPITPTTAIPHDHSEPVLDRTVTIDGKARPYWDLVSWAGLVTVAWLPATLAPVGRTRSGLPVGWQIVGPWLEDRTPLEFAKLTEDLVGGFEPPPL